MFLYQKCVVVLLSRSEQAGRVKCPVDPYFIIPDKCVCVDFQTLRLQEAPDAVPHGEMPRHMQLYCDRYKLSHDAERFFFLVCKLFCICYGLSACVHCIMNRIQQLQCQLKMFLSKAGAEPLRISKRIWTNHLIVHIHKDTCWIWNCMLFLLFILCLFMTEIVIIAC